MIRSLILILTMAATASLTRAEDLMLFGTKEGRQAKFDATAGSAAKITFGEDYLKMVGPNFWSNRWQFNNHAVDLSDAKPTDYLAIEAVGDIADTAPILKVLLVSPDWSKQSIWYIDLSQLKKDEFHILPATTSLALPAEKIGGGVALGAPVGNVMFMTSAKSGMNPWLLKIKSLTCGANDAKPAEKK